MSDSTPRSFLGTGWAFPPRFSAGGAELALVSGTEDVHESLRVLLATRPGERPMQEDFGCSLDDALFGEIDQALVNRITAAIGEAILRHEPRVELDEVDVSDDPREAGTLWIRVAYTILATNSRYNMVFPFYLNEAITPGL
ncbi:MAG TPA: GPW/gp25 family protein [Enhygromyxa sp.]|nr:GPW/gp25 family protein [Enhygromyxa sp.]